MADEQKIKQIRKAAEQGDADAQCELGFCYELGIGVSQDFQEAVKWYRKAAEQGYASAQCGLGACYEKGAGVSQDFQEAVKWYRKAAEQGNAWAQYSLGCCYRLGHGVSQDFQEAVKWYRKAAEQGFDDAQNNLGECYENGTGIPQDYQEAVKWFRKAAEQGHDGAQCNLGFCYEKGRGVSQDFQEAVKWYRKAADQGHAKAKESLNRLKQKMKEKSQLQNPDSMTGKAPVRISGGVENQAVTKPDSDTGSADEQKIKQTRKAAEQGDADAQFNLGDYYSHGDGVSKDFQEAVKWYRKAAEQGHAHAQFNLGLCYASGNGVPQDFQEAVKWYRKAAEQGDADAQFHLARGILDPQEAIEWYRKAAEQGHAGAQCNLGLCYDDGTGVSRDIQQAVKWYRKAAEQGIVGAQYNLGLCYEKGRGISQDFQEAVKWYRKAADQGHAKAKESLNRLERKMAKKGQPHNPDSMTGKAPVRISGGAENQAVTKPDSDSPDYPEPYSGSQPYIFISCAHGDKAAALPLIRRLKDAGLRLWYDKGTDPGPESDDVIADRLLHCDGFVALISKNYLNSENCKDELKYARDLSKERLLIYLEDVKLPPALQMRLSRLQAIFYHKCESMDAFMKEALRASLFVRNLTGQ